MGRSLQNSGAATVIGGRKFTSRSRRMGGVERRATLLGKPIRISAT